MKNGLQPKFLAETQTGFDAKFLRDMQDLFAGRRFGHVGYARYSKPLYEGDPVNGLAMMLNVMAKHEDGTQGPYYIGDDEKEIIQDSAQDLQQFVEPHTIFGDYGPGDAFADKISPILVASGDKIDTYVAIDRVPDILKKATNAAKSRFPEKNCITRQCDFFKEKVTLPEGKRLTAIFGQTMFNLETDPRNARALRSATLELLRRLRGNLNAGDHLLITQDHNPNTDEIIAAYEEQKTVWENMLLRVQRDLPVSEGFDPKGFRYEPDLITETGTLAHSFVATKAMKFTLGHEYFSVRPGHRFFPHNSCKFSRALFKSMTDEAELSQVYANQNEKRRTSFLVLQR